MNTFEHSLTALLDDVASSVHPHPDPAALFMPRQNRANVVALLTQGLMQRHAAAAWIGINRVCPQPNEHLDQNLGSVYCLCCFFNGSQRRDFHYRVFKTGWTFMSNSCKTTKDKNAILQYWQADLNIHPQESDAL